MARGSVRGPSLGALVGGVLALAGFLLGSRSLSDNSFLTHLATGRLIIDSGAVPSSDPYTFTASGEPWVVQSWLVSLLVATAEELGGPGAIRLVMGSIAAGAVGVAWALTRTCEAVFSRVVLVGLVLGVAAQTWSERPFLLGLLLLAVSQLIAERRWSPWYLVPVGWVWANAHGSFPLGIGLLVLLAVGGRLDGVEWRHEARCAVALTAGVVAGVAGPLGPRLLLFPVQLVAGSEVLGEVVEWQSPPFDTPSQRLFLVQLALAVGLLARRPSWRTGLPLLLFSLAAVTSLRNVAVASLALLPAMSGSMPSLGQLRSSAVPRPAPLVAAALALLGVVLAASVFREPHFQLREGYPVVALAWSASAGTGPDAVRTATPDTVGNLLDLLYGDAGVTFYDDRYDMFPSDVSDAFLRLQRTRPGWRSSLDGHRVDAVIWERSHPLSQLLVADPEWSLRFTDDRWSVFARR